MFDNNVYGLVAISMIKELRQILYRETAVSSEAVSGQQSPEKGSKPLPCATHPALPVSGQCLMQSQSGH
jgi:hypothetical protein